MAIAMNTGSRSSGVPTGTPITTKRTRAHGCQTIRSFDSASSTSTSSTLKPTRRVTHTASTRASASVASRSGAFTSMCQKNVNAALLSQVIENLDWIKLVKLARNSPFWDQVMRKLLRNLYQDADFSSLS